jgi:uracil phosphoribosyltransferase
LNPQLHIIDHPLIATKLSRLRAKDTATAEFRSLLQQLSVLLLAEASRSWSTIPSKIETPLCSCEGTELANPVVLVPILRAGLGMLDGMLQIMPDARVGHLGLYRDEKTLRPVTYYSRLPKDVGNAQVLLLDPMLATGHSACAAVSIIKDLGVQQIQFICVVACPTGIAQLQKEHADVPIIAAAVDHELNSIGYIVPGLGDAGDRYFGTA